MYNEFKDIFNYLVSIRKLKTYLSIDIEFPITWKIPKRFVDEDKIMENQKVNEDKRFFSFVSEFNQINLDKTVQNIKNIISYNKEIEMKERLLKQKIDELKKIFESKNLENLQTLKFELLEQQLNDGEEKDKFLKLEVAYSSYNYRSGWNAAWGLMKDIELVTNRGGVYLFSVDKGREKLWIDKLKDDSTCSEEKLKKKISDIRNKEVKKILFDEYLMKIDNANQKNQSIMNFFKKT